MFAEFSALPPIALAACAGLIGLLVGSFLNVVVYRYPNRLKHSWTVQSREWLELKPETDTEEAPPGIIFPPSHCGNCKAPVRAWQNIPVISYLLLRGKCANCGVKISFRYPFVELLTAVMTGVVAYKFGWSLQAGFGILLTWVLISLSFIDFDHKLLPDDFVLPTMWLGLTLSLWGVFTTPENSIIGAIAGYLCFWIVFQVFLLLTGKEGMGHGDFKLIALLGAWFGWQYLPQVILISTLVGSVFGIGIMIARKKAKDLEIPFGPYIAIAGWIAMLWGDQINTAYLRFSGIS